MTLREEGSLPGIKTRTTIRLGPFFLLFGGHLRPNPEKRDEWKILIQPWIQPHLKPENSLYTSQARESDNFPFCCNVIEFTNKITITNTIN